MKDPASGRVPGRAPERFLVATEACGGGTPDLSSVLEVLGYVGIYGCRGYVGGSPGCSRGRGRAQGGVPSTLMGSPGLPWRALQAHMVGFLPKLTSLVDFVPFGLRLIFLFFKILK